jgi:uncharacterized RDD family membrane protein YckC
MNPFEAPRPAPPEPVLSESAAQPLERFAARLVDQAALVGACLPSLGWLAGARWLESRASLYALLPSALLLVALVGWQWWTVSRDGTTVGKRLVGIRIVNFQDGRPPGFLAGVVVRGWVPRGLVVLLGLVTSLGGALSLLDGALVFSAGGRTLHDRLAGTRVIKVRKTSVSGG